MVQSGAAAVYAHGTRPCIRPVGRRWIAARAAHLQSASIDVAHQPDHQGRGAAHTPVGRRAAMWTAVVGGALCTTPSAVLAEELAQMEGSSLEVAQRLEQLQVRLAPTVVWF